MPPVKEKKRKNDVKKVKEGNGQTLFYLLSSTSPHKHPSTTKWTTANDFLIGRDEIFRRPDNFATIGQRTFCWLYISRKKKKPRFAMSGEREEEKHTSNTLKLSHAPAPGKPWAVSNFEAVLALRVKREFSLLRNETRVAKSDRRLHSDTRSRRWGDETHGGSCTLQTRSTSSICESDIFPTAKLSASSYVGRGQETSTRWRTLF